MIDDILSLLTDIPWYGLVAILAVVVWISVRKPRFAGSLSWVIVVAWTVAAAIVALTILPDLLARAR